MFRGDQEDAEKTFQPVLNPNQRQFKEDEKRYKHKLKLLHGGVKFSIGKCWTRWINIYFAEITSPSHFFMRRKDEELDPDLLDKHDSFYHTTKSLLVLFQIMGVMPIQRSPPGKGKQHTFTSEQCQHHQFSLSRFTAEAHHIQLLFARSHVGILCVRSAYRCGSHDIPWTCRKFPIVRTSIRWGNLQCYFSEYFISAFFAARGLVASRLRSGQIQEYVDQLSIAVSEGNWNTDRIPASLSDNMGTVFCLVDNIVSSNVHSILLPTGFSVLAYVCLLSHHRYVEWILQFVVYQLHCIWRGQSCSVGQAAGDAAAAEASTEINRIPTLVGRFEPHDAATGQSVFEYVRHILFDHILHHDYCHLWCA